MIVFAVASELELRSLRRMIDVERAEVFAGRSFYFGSMQGREVCLVKTGAGRKNAAAAARKICSFVQPDLVIIAGAAGALDPALELGAVVMVEDVVRENNAEEISCSEEDASNALTVLRSAGIKAIAGRCCQVATFTHQTADKRGLYEKTGALVVDMESAAFAAEFQAAGLSFINLRIVSDTAGCDTADMETLVRLRYRRGNVSAVLYLLRHPRELMRAIQFYRGMNIADKRIADAVYIMVAAG